MIGTWKERPILFSAPMVRALLARTKTQTRRLMKPQPADDIAPCVMPNPAFQGWQSSLRHEHGPTTAHLCPFGQVGDRLWVRETWSAFTTSPGDMPGHHEVEFTGKIPEKPTKQIAYRADDGWEDGDVYGPWKPAIHMPRWASRITLEVTGVRVERVQAITDADAKAEGARHFPDLPVGPLRGYEPPRWSMEDPETTDECLGAPRWAFANLWQKLNGDDSWDLNPWVWVVEFKAVTP